MKATIVEIPNVVARQAKDAVGAHYVVLTRRGKPVMYLLPASIYDEEDIGYMTDPDFWKMIAERRKEGGWIPFEQVKAELAQREKAEKQAKERSRAVTKKSRSKRDRSAA